MNYMIIYTKGAKILNQQRTDDPGTAQKILQEIHKSHWITNDVTNKPEGTVTVTDTLKRDAIVYLKDPIFFYDVKVIDRPVIILTKGGRLNIIDVRNEEPLKTATKILVFEKTSSGQMYIFTTAYDGDELDRDALKRLIWYLNIR